MTLAKTKTYIKCKGCGKEIEKKGLRQYCIRCRNQMDKKRNKGYRDQPGYREKYNKMKREMYYAEKESN